MKIVLAYSGGLDTTVAIRWLKETFNADVVTVSVDVGQSDDFKKLEERAYLAGAVKHYTIDAKEEFAKRFIAYDIIMNGLYEDVYPLSTALARPLIAEKTVEVAKKEETEYVAHGSTSKGNDQVRFDLAIKAMMPNAKIIAPARIWKMTREDEVKYARESGIPIKVESTKYSIDENLWGRSIEGDEIADPSVEVPEEAFEWTRRVKQGKLRLSIEFDRGIPIRVNGEKMSLVDLVKFLNSEVGKYGFGRVEHLENRVVGFKSRENYEVPAALVLISAHKDLEKTVYTPLELRFKKVADAQWTDLVYQGLWYEPLRETLQLVGEQMNKWVSGEVKVEIDGNGMRILGRDSKYSPYSDKIASYNKGWYPTDEMARGFIEIWGLHSLLTRQVRYG
ncbi:MAG: argininosuccinate synthase [Candidatus Aramenus sulfurataquae]|jgi:argininosuccinate synthase|uniref:Argininosuccinate synthase n=2 Tax=Candidatus Aramenus sulfurataquae TaxID=1326980 RepID=W7KPN9_9CREN|nr:MAG: argininosuccinate synthase [Candidatus Aramenus sulfurataquae]MCL7343079.1 argininosuccinate synthase [Candidatus Aramenus sulfurataquae]